MFVENQRYIRKPKGIFRNIEFKCKFCGEIGIANSITKTTCFSCRKDSVARANRKLKEKLCEENPKKKVIHGGGKSV